MSPRLLYLLRMPRWWLATSQLWDVMDAMAARERLRANVP